MRLTVLGTGYVGLVTGACLAHAGHRLTCLDVDEEKVRSLREGRVPIFEPGLTELLSVLGAAGRIAYTSDYEAALAGAEAVFICVGTPSLPDGQADMSAVQSAATMLGRHLANPYTVVVNKSTVPIGSGDWVGMLMREGLRQRQATRVRSAPCEVRSSGSTPSDTHAQKPPAPVALAERGEGPGFDVVSNPEFLREGSAVRDALYPERIVIGSDSERAIGVMRAIYRPILERTFPPLPGTPREEAAGAEAPLLVTDRTSAEMIKYAANAFLATKISFINEMANLCERIGADVSEVARGIGMDSRIGQGFLNAGIGWGGSCFPKDLASLCFTAREYGYECRLLEATQGVNASQRLLVIRKLQDRLKVLKGKTVTLWGLAFKPGTDDVRDAPAHSIARRLLELGVRVQAYDPVAIPNARRWGLAAEYCDSAVAAAQESDAIVLVTDWPEFATQSWAEVRAAMRRALVIDGRNFLPRAELLVHGFEYCGVGR